MVRISATHSSHRWGLRKMQRKQPCRSQKSASTPSLSSREISKSRRSRAQERWEMSLESARSVELCEGTRICRWSRLMMIQQIHNNRDRSSAIPQHRCSQEHCTTVEIENIRNQSNVIRVCNWLFFCSTYNSNQLEYSISRFQIFHVKADGKAISFSFDDARRWGRLWMWMHDDSVWTARWSWHCLFWSEKSRHLWNLLWVHTMSWMIQFRGKYVSRLKFDKERIWVILCMFLSQSSERDEDVTQCSRSEFFHEWTR